MKELYICMLIKNFQFPNSNKFYQSGHENKCGYSKVHKALLFSSCHLELLISKKQALDDKYKCWYLSIDQRMLVY